MFLALRTMAEVRLAGVRKVYGGSVAAIEALDLTVEHGTFLCVLGPSGSGKSTVLKLIAGIEEVTSGKIFIGGEDVTNLPPERRDVAMVFQSYALYPTMTVFDNIAFPLRVRKVEKSSIERRVEETARLLDIEGLLRRRPRELSGGERQRVALGRAIIREPKVFLLDEPLSNLDANLRVQTRRELKRIQDLLGATFIYVTHDQDDALAMGDEVALLSKGRLEQYARSAEVYETPANRFVASFIGRPPMNLFEGEMALLNQGLLFRNKDLTLPLQAALHLENAGRRITVGIRPEAIALCRPGVGDCGIQGVVTDVAVIQPNVYVTVQVGSAAVLAQLRNRAEWPSHGEQVGLAIDRDQVHVFDGATGTRLEREADPGLREVASMAARSLADGSGLG